MSKSLFDQKVPSSMMDEPEPRVFTADEEEQKRHFYERMSPRRRKFIDRIGYDVWDPFEGPKEPMDIRVDITQRTTQELLREFLQTVPKENASHDYSRGELECALGVVNKEDKYRGIFDFCIWYHSLLQQEQGK